MDDGRRWSEFETFCERVEPRLRRAFVGWCGPELAADAVAEALAWAWEHPHRLERVDNQIGYLYRVGQSKVRRRRQALMEPLRSPPDVPRVEPALMPALRALPDRQRTAVWLTTACGFTHEETANAMGITRSAVGTHVTRGLEKLRLALGATSEGSRQC